MPGYRLVRTIENVFFANLRGVGVDADGQLWAVGDSECRAYDAEGVLQQSWLTAMPPHSVAVSRRGEVFVGEEGQVEIFDASGELAGTWSDPEKLGLVTSIGFVDDDVLFGDAVGRAIRRYDSKGQYLNDIGTDNRQKGFRIPNGVVDFGVDADGVIHAANPGMHRVERYAVDGQLLGRFGRFNGVDPAGFSGCCNPTNVAVAGRDQIYTSEKAGPRAKVYDVDGNLVAVIADEVFDANAKNMDIAVDSAGRVYVADTAQRAVFVFAPEEA